MLTPSCEHNFFERCKAGKVYTYFHSYYMIECVRTLANKKGVIIEYCKPGTPEYKQYGCFAFKVLHNPINGTTVLTVPKKTKKIKHKFNIDNLVLN